MTTIQKHSRNMLLFVVILALAFVFFTIRSEADRQQARTLAYKNCLLNDRIADNQRSVLIALLAHVRADVARKADTYETDVTIPALVTAIANIPQYNCKKE